MTRFAITLWGSCLLLAFTISARGQDAAPQDVTELLRSSAEAYRAADFAEFRRLMTRVVALDPTNCLHRYNLACGSARDGAAPAAIEALQELLRQECDLVVLADTDGDFDAIRSAPGFQAIGERIKRMKQPIERSRLAFSIPEKDLIPEGIAYDPVDDCFYLGSIQKCKILRIERSGEVSDFVESRQDDLLPVIGMRVDAERRHLWAAASFGFPRPDLPAELLGSSGVFKYDLRTGELLAKYLLPREEHHFLNDLTINAAGEVYVTDWRVFAIYKISPESDTIEKLVDMPRQPNGIDLSEDESKLFIGGAGIGVLDLASGGFRELDAPPNLWVGGDGLYYHRNSLISIQSGAIERVGRFQLGEAQDSIIGCQPLEAWHPQFNMPTTGVVVGESFFYIANSQIGETDDAGHLPPLSELEETRIFELDLGR